jgi:hypothetical protein
MTIKKKSKSNSYHNPPHHHLLNYFTPRLQLLHGLFEVLLRKNTYVSDTYGITQWAVDVWSSFRAAVNADVLVRGRVKLLGH